MTLSELAMNLATRQAAEQAATATAMYTAEKAYARAATTREVAIVIRSALLHPDLGGDEIELKMVWKDEAICGYAALDYIMLTHRDEQFALECNVRPVPHKNYPALIVSVEEFTEDGEVYLYRRTKEFSSLAEFGAILSEYPDRPVTPAALSLEPDLSRP